MLSAAQAEGTSPHAPACVTLPALATGGVTHALATVFTEAVASGALTGSPGVGLARAREAQMYEQGDAVGAHAAGMKQIERYAKLRRGGRLTDLRKALAADPTGSRAPIGPMVPLCAGVLLECADPVREPAELERWAGLGVVMVGMAWVGPGRYAGGNSTQLGLTALGRALVPVIDRLRLVHDASHLSDLSFAQLAASTDRLIVASHSNCRRLLGGGAAGVNQRHLSDGQIVEITRRGGVIGLNLFSAFLNSACASAGRATIADAVSHVDHVCALAGSRRHVGLGSDMDGGFSAARLPEGIDGPEDLDRLAEALSERGWSDEEVAGFAFGNWARVLSGVLGGVLGGGAGSDLGSGAGSGTGSDLGSGAAQ